MPPSTPPNSPRAGPDGAGEPLDPDLYRELRAVAGALLAGERPGHTLQPTALAHEACGRADRAETELVAVKRELDRAAHAVAVAGRREAHARQALTELGDLSSRRLHEAGAAASEDATKHQRVLGELAAAHAEAAAAKADASSLELELGRVRREAEASAAERDTQLQRDAAPSAASPARSACHSSPEVGSSSYLGAAACSSTSPSEKTSEGAAARPRSASVEM